jgi:hypothetical protein
MSTYSTQRRVEGPFRSADPLDPLTEFYHQNGYRRKYREETDAVDDRDAADGQSVERVFTRGHTAANWWASNMTKLPTRVEIRRDETALEITYEVDVTGQHFTDEDRDFWRRELDAACDYLQNPSRTPRDLRHEEAKRAERIRRRMLSYGIWGAVGAFLIILLLKLMTSL